MIHTVEPVSRTGGAANERWLFTSHGWGSYGGSRYDPTFGLTGADNLTVFANDSIYCRKLTNLGAPTQVRALVEAYPLTPRHQSPHTPRLSSAAPGGGTRVGG